MTPVVLARAFSCDYTFCTDVFVPQQQLSHIVCPVMVKPLLYAFKLAAGFWRILVYSSRAFVMIFLRYGVALLQCASARL